VDEARSHSITGFTYANGDAVPSSDREPIRPGGWGAAATIIGALVSAPRDHLHISNTPPTAASGHGWWEKGSSDATAADVTIQLQINRGGSWVEVGPAGRNRVKPAAARPTGRLRGSSVSAPLPTESVYVRRPIPVEPLLVCTGDALNRIGTLSLTAVQLLLPVQASGSAESQLMSTVKWFGTSDPAARATVRITLDIGEGEGLRPLARELLALVHARHTGPFVIESLSSDDTVAVDPQPPVVDDRWRGQVRSPVTFEATVPEWSLDAVGWLVALFADVCRHVGVETSVLVGVAR
jgi:hypothetical protein